jgi:hypothetical protein
MLLLHQLLYVLFTLCGIFMHFFGTNLLTRCHSASSCFLLFFYFRFLPKDIFSELDEIKAKVPIFLTRRRSPKGRRRWARRRPHHAMALAHLWSCLAMVWAPRAPTNIAFHLYIASDAKTINQSASIHEKFCSAATIEDQFRGTEVPVLAPCRDGELPPEPSP